MAVSRVGGTKAKLRGQVGNEIYQVKKNPDGTYTQVVYQKGVRTEERLTPELQAQRMCVAIVESMMKRLKPVVKISFQSGRNKSASANAFSSINLMKIMRDCRQNWYGDNKFVFVRRRNDSTEIKDLGGPIVISSGTLLRNLFDWQGEAILAANQVNGLDPYYQIFIGVQFDCLIGVETLDSFMQRHQMTIMDTVVWCGFREWYEWRGEDDDAVVHDDHCYIIASMKYGIPGRTVLTEAVLRDLFSLNSNIQADIYIKSDGKGFGIGHAVQYMTIDEVFYYKTAFSISYWTGKKLISNSFYEDEEGGESPWLRNAFPAYVFGSWMGDPNNLNYPSPYV